MEVSLLYKVVFVVSTDWGLERAITDLPVHAGTIPGLPSLDSLDRCQLRSHGPGLINHQGGSATSPISVVLP